MSAPDRRALVDRGHDAVGSPAMPALERRPLRRLSAAAPRERERSCADASDRRAVHGLAVPWLAPHGADAANGRPAAEPQAHAAADAEDGHCRARAEAADDKGCAGTQDIPVFAA